jgi:hypothetical protein
MGDDGDQALFRTAVGFLRKSAYVHHAGVTGNGCGTSRELPPHLKGKGAIKGGRAVQHHCVRDGEAQVGLSGEGAGR